MHYLDDCITCGAPDSDECKFNLQMLLDICNHLGVSIAEEKVEGPSTSIVFWVYSLTQSKMNFGSPKISWQE